MLDRIVSYVERAIVQNLRIRIQRGRRAFTALVSIGCLGQTGSSLQGKSHKTCEYILCSLRLCCVLFSICALSVGVFNV